MIPLNQVPTDKHLLWYYDDEMTHDLLQIQTYLGYNYTFLVERAVVNNVVWCDNYSTALFQALLPLSTVKENYDLELATTSGNNKVTLPPSNSRVTFSFLIEQGRSIYDDVRYIKRHHYNYITGQQITLPNMLKYSLVISCDDPDYDLDTLKQSIPSDYLYDNINDLENEYDFPDELVKLQRTIRQWELVDLTLDKVNWDLETDRIDVIPNRDLVSEIITNLPEQPQQHGLLIYAQPQYDPITGQGQNDPNIIIGNPLLQPIFVTDIISRYNSEIADDIATANNVVTLSNFPTFQPQYLNRERMRAIDTVRRHDWDRSHSTVKQFYIILGRDTVVNDSTWLSQIATITSYNGAIYNKQLDINLNTSFNLPRWSAEEALEISLQTLDNLWAEGLNEFGNPPPFPPSSPRRFADRAVSQRTSNLFYWNGGSVTLPVLSVQTYYPDGTEMYIRFIGGEFRKCQSFEVSAGVCELVPSNDSRIRSGDIQYWYSDYPVTFDQTFTNSGANGANVSCTFVNFIDSQDVFYGHWLKEADITSFLDPQWLVKRQRWHNRYETLKTTIGLEFSKPLNVLSMTEEVTNPYPDNEDEIVNISTLIEQLNNDIITVQQLYDHLRIKLGINRSLTVLFNQTKSIFDTKIIRQPTQDNNTQIPSDEDLQKLLVIELIYMNDSLRIQEIHAILGCSNPELLYYEDEQNNQQFTVTSIGWLTDKLAKAWGISYNADGSVRSVRQRKRVAYNNQGQVTIPEGWARGQFSVNKGDGQPHNPNDLTRQNGGETDEERTGIVYQNRCNKYENFDDDDPENNVLKRGDIILCENMLQYIESYLEDLDKGLNWQEMGTGVLPSADSTGFCTYEGMGTLLAEVAYMISQLSSNIYETHNLSLMTFNNTIELFKAIGVPTGVSIMKIDTGEPDPQVEGETQKANMIMPRVADDAPSLTTQMYNLLSNIALLIGAFSELPEQENEPQPQ